MASLASSLASQAALTACAATGSPAFLCAAFISAADPEAAAQAQQAIVVPLVGALLAPLLFAACLFACSRASATLALGCCPIASDEHDLDDTSPWRAGAEAAKWRFLGACYCFAQGLSLVAAGAAMPWLPFAASLTLPLLASSGLLFCGVPLPLPALQAVCTGGTLMTAGSATLYGAIALGLAAWLVAWVLTIRARNLAHWDTLPASACCGHLPAALYAGAASTLLALAGVILTWSGFNALVGLVPASLRPGAPPGGVAVAAGLLCLLAGCLALLWASAALGGRPVPSMTGASFASLCPAPAGGARKLRSGAQRSGNPLAAEPLPEPLPEPVAPPSPAEPQLADLHRQVRVREVRLAARFLLEREDCLPPGWRCVAGAGAGAGRAPQFRAPTGALQASDPRNDTRAYVAHFIDAWRGGADVLARVPEDLGARVAAHAAALLREDALPPRWAYQRGEFVAPCGTRSAADPRLSPLDMEEEVAAAIGARAL